MPNEKRVAPDPSTDPSFRIVKLESPESEAFSDDRTIFGISGDPRDPCLLVVDGRVPFLRDGFDEAEPRNQGEDVSAGENEQLSDLVHFLGEVVTVRPRFSSTRNEPRGHEGIRANLEGPRHALRFRIRQRLQPIGVDDAKANSKSGKSKGLQVLAVPTEEPMTGQSSDETVAAYARERQTIRSPQ